MTAPISISVLMSVYSKDRAPWVQDSLDSLIQQTVPPTEIILVIDGPISDDLEKVLAETGRRLGDQLQIVRLVENQGLAAALNAGLTRCRSEYVARMDSDDICVPERFAIQAGFLAEHPETGLIASWHAEFDTSPDEIQRIKTTPEHHDEIVRGLRWRNVMSHPTIVVRRDDLLRIHGYSTTVGLLEDYDLYARLIRAGVRFHAVQKPLVLVRVLRDTRVRRGGLAYVRNALKFRRHLWTEGFINFRVFVLSSIAWGLFGLWSPRMRGVVYWFIRRRSV